MGRESSSDSSTSPAPSLGQSSSYHLFSTIVIVAWTLFVGATVIVHELAVRVTWDPSRVATGADIPWVYRAGNGLPSILRTVFAQAHGPITAMHLARLAITAPDISWASPKTWMEVCWLADRRWASPIGLGKIGWTLASRRVRVSITFALLAALSIVALVTPVIMTRTYPVVTDDVAREVTASVSMLVLERLIPLNNADQMNVGNELWSKGVTLPELLPRNAYAESDAHSLEAGGAWFFTGESSKSEMSLVGIRVAGGCEVVKTTSIGEGAFEDLCTAEFGAGFDTDSIGNPTSALPSSWLTTPSYIAVTQRVGEEYARAMLSDYGVRNISTCASIDSWTEFGLESQQPSTALYRIWTEEDYPVPEETIVRCTATAAAGTASVDGRTMTFSDFAYTAPNFDESNVAQHLQPLDPVAAVMESLRNNSTNLIPFQKSVDLKMNRVWAKGIDTDDAAAEIHHLPATAAAMWDGLIAMSAELWYQGSAPVQQTGIQRLTTTGIRREDSFFYVLIALLGVWFVGMLAGSAALLRPTWASSLDGYAAVRMLQHRPDLISKREAQFGMLEDNADLLEAFAPGLWRSS